MAGELYHVKFVDSDDEEMPSVEHALPPSTKEQQQPPAIATKTTAPSPSSSLPFTAFHCATSVRTDYDTNDQCYVLQLVHTPKLNIVAAVLSNHLIKLFSLRESGISFIGQLHGHTASIRDASFGLPDEPYILHSSSSDGTVRAWDVRSGQQTEAYNTGRLDVLSCSTNGTLVAAGGGDKVLLWDRKTGKPAAAFEDAHMQDVTQVRFHPERRGILVSGSEDGMLAVFDTSTSLNEDDGFLAGLNIDTGVAKLGFYGVGGSKLWCCSSTETLHLWEWADACNEDMAQGGNGALGEAVNARSDLHPLAQTCGLQPSNPTSPSIDYLIGCEPTTSSNKCDLLLAAGNISGGVGFFPVVQPPSGSIGGAISFGPAVASMRGGHEDIVRSVLWPGCSGPVCLTGGEDGRVCVWSSSSNTGDGGGGSQQPQPSSSGSEGVMRRQAPARRASPYDK